MTKKVKYRCNGNDSVLKYILSIFCLLLLIFLSACGDSSKPKARGNYDEFEGARSSGKGVVQEVEYGGHSFVVFAVLRGVSAIHSPDCRCINSVEMD